LNRIVY